MGSSTVDKYFADEISRGIPIFSGGAETIDFVPLAEEEAAAITECVTLNARRIRAIAPAVADNFENQLSAFLKWGAVAKARFPESKAIRYPAETATIGVEVITPALYKYNTTPSGTYPCYCDYDNNKWSISLTAGTASYIAGGASTYYMGSPTTSKHSMNVIANQGLVEVGTSPKISQISFKSAAQTKYSPLAVHPLVSQTVEENKSIYQYSTLGMIPQYHDFGTKIGVMPHTTGTSWLELIGLTFYEQGLMSDLTYIS